MRTRLATLLGILFVTAGMQAGQTSGDFVGTWKPQDAARSETLFDVGLSDVTAEGLRISRTGDTITLTRLDSAGLLARRSQIGMFVQPVATYTLDPERSTPSVRRYTGTHGRAVLDRTTLVIETVAPHASWQTTFELENGQMKAVTTSADRPTTVVQYYARAGN